MPINSIAS